MLVTKPKVKDLMAFLAGRDPEPLLLIGGKYSGASTRLKRPSALTKWMLTEHLTMAVTPKESLRNETLHPET